MTKYLFTLACTLAFIMPFDIAAQAAELPSCRSITYPGPNGFLAVHTTMEGRVQWVGGLNIKLDEAGYYVIDVLVNGKRADRKNKHYLYFPHGSLPPSIAPSGATFVLQVDLQSDSGAHYVSVM
jgi:hypothetical protein